MEIFLEVCSKLADGFVTSFFLFALTLILALPLGLLMSFCTMSKLPYLRIPMKLIVWVLRGTPLMLQIFAIFYLPGLLNLFIWPQVNTGCLWLDTTFTTRFWLARSLLTERATTQNTTQRILFTLLIPRLKRQFFNPLKTTFPQLLLFPWQTQALNLPPSTPKSATSTLSTLKKESTWQSTFSQRKKAVNLR